MAELLHFFQNLHSAEGLQELIRTGGLVVVVAIVFSETGLLAGFFLPGDSLLVTAGIFASSDMIGGQPIFHLESLLGCVIVAAVIGDQLGFFLGRKAGPLIFKAEDSWIFKKKHLNSAHAFYEKYGPRALIGARFVPIFRTFVPFVAGVAQMRYWTFFRYSLIGGVVWVSSMVLLGFYLGKTPMAQKLHQVILVIIFVSILPVVITVAKNLIQRRRSPPADKLVL